MAGAGCKLVVNDDLRGPDIRHRDAAAALRRPCAGQRDLRSLAMSGPDLPCILPELLPRLWAFALRITGDRHDAEDLVQRACVRALERADQLQPGSTPLSWMFSIIHTTWLNELRARSVRGRSRVTWDDALLETVVDHAAGTPEMHLTNQQLIRAVARLPDTQRVTLLLVSIEGMTYEEAARTLGVPPGTVMSRISRARRTLGEWLSPPRDAGDPGHARAERKARDAQAAAPLIDE
jgi:RNA polymerase sigma-70 factor (ECF subfamily)